MDEIHNPITTFNAITLMVAGIGAALGILNTWRLFDRDRVKLLVTPKRAMPVTMKGISDVHGLCIGIVNLGFVPVTISDVGVFYKDTTKRGVLTNPIMIDGGKFPRRLEPREAFTVYTQPGYHLNDKKFSNVKCAYAKTDCGKTFRGKSKALNSLKEESFNHFFEN